MSYAGLADCTISAPGTQRLATANRAVCSASHPRLAYAPQRHGWGRFCLCDASNVSRKREGKREGRGGTRGERGGERKRRRGEEARDLRGKPLKEGSKGEWRRGGVVMERGGVWGEQEGVG
jgi:hypothetical protein